MKLYSVGLSPFAARVRASIYVKGLDIEIVAPPEAGTKSPEYLALNPMGKIPVLVLDDGTTLPESETIVEYLEDVFPQKPLRPASPEARARARLIARVGELYVWPHISALFPQMNPKTRDQAVVDAAFAGLRQGLVHLEGFLGEGPFAACAAFTTADGWLIPALFFIGMAGGTFGVSDLLAPHAKLTAYAKAMSADPVAQKLTAEMQAGLAAMRGG
jgi:glutathione S-transferase